MPGHLHRQPSGAWRLVVYAGQDPDTGRKRQITKTFRGSKKEAGEELARLVLTVAEGRHGPDRTIAFSALCRRWLDQRGPDLSPGTVENYEGILAALPKGLASTPVGKLRPHDLDAYYAHLRKTGLSAATIRRRHAFFRSVLQQAVKWQLLTYNVAALASPPRVQQTDSHPPDAATLKHLIGTADTYDEDFGVLLRLAAVTGARRAELVSLRWADVDLDRGTVTISRSTVQIRGGTVIKAPKSGRSRTVAIGPATTAALTAHRVRMAEKMLRFGLALDAGTFLFQSSPGVQMRPDGVNHRFALLRTKAGITGVRFHDLRHAVATLLHDEQVSNATVSKRLGHARQSTTLDLYTASIDGRDREAADIMERLLG